jgi:xanthine dehydrogenase YagT iron-sulfur-binding subunit
MYGDHESHGSTIAFMSVPHRPYGLCRPVTTPQRLHPMQAAFIKHDGYQCRYCTPGQICSAVGVLDEIRRGVPSHATADLTARPLLSADELRERMSGNLCRCGAYSNIVEAISGVAGVKA